MSTGASQLNPLFGRKWQIEISQIAPAPPTVGATNPPATKTVLLSVSDNGNDYQAARITFDISLAAFQGAKWECAVCLYNLDVAANAILDQLATQQAQQLFVTVSAGYQDGSYGVLWQGLIFQSFLERENVTDLKLTILSFIRLPPIGDAGDVGETYPAEQTQQQLVRNIAKQATVPVYAIAPDAEFKSAPLPRSVTIFGNLNQHLTDLAVGNNMQWWLSAEGLNFGGADDSLGLSPNPSFIFSPPSNATSLGQLPPLPAGTIQSIVGTPEETMQAVEFDVLLEPRLKVIWPLQTVQICNAQLRYYKKQVGQFFTPLDQDGIYVVSALRHFGDSRGEPWYTHITGMKRVGNSLALMTAQQASFNGS
jgi:hypothetical protein